MRLSGTDRVSKICLVGTSDFPAGRGRKVGVHEHLHAFARVPLHAHAHLLRPRGEPVVVRHALRLLHGPLAHLPLPHHLRKCLRGR